VRAAGPAALRAHQDRCPTRRRRAARMAAWRRAPPGLLAACQVGLQHARLRRCPSWERRLRPRGALRVERRTACRSRPEATGRHPARGRCSGWAPGTALPVPARRGGRLPAGQERPPRVAHGPVCLPRGRSRWAAPGGRPSSRPRGPPVARARGTGQPKPPDGRHRPAAWERPGHAPPVARRERCPRPGVPGCRPRVDGLPHHRPTPGPRDALGHLSRAPRPPQPWPRLHPRVGPCPRVGARPCLGPLPPGPPLPDGAEPRASAARWPGPACRRPPGCRQGACRSAVRVGPHGAPKGRVRRDAPEESEAGWPAWNVRSGPSAWPGGGLPGRDR